MTADLSPKKTFAIVTHCDLWRLRITNQVAKQLHADGHKVRIIYSQSDPERTNGGGIEALAGIRSIQEKFARESLFPFAEKQADTLGRYGALLTPDQMAEKYCDGRIEIVPAMRKPGRGVNGGAILEAELDAIKPDFVLSLDTYARLTPGVCEKHTVVGIHPGNLRESPNLHSVLRTLIANSQNNNRSQTITGTVHLVSGNVVDGGTPVAEVVVPYNRSAGAYQVRQNVYDALANLMLDEIVSKLIAEGRDGFIREKFVQEGELLPPLTQEDVMRHFVHGERPLFRYKEVLETIAGFLPDREAMLSADFPKIPLIEKHEVKKFARPTAPLYRVADTEGLQVA